MRIITLSQKYYFYTILLLSLVGINSSVYSQCPTVTNPNQSFCDTQSPTINDLVAVNNGGGIKWYATATSTTALASSAALQNGEDYFADDVTGTCGTRQSVVVTIYSAPIADPFQGPCVENLNDATLAAFTAIGNNIQWYATSTGGSPLPLTTIITNGTIYYASQTNPDTGCESSRRAVRAVVGYVPTPTGPAIQNFCNVLGVTPTVNDLVASGNNNWYLNSFSSVPLSLATPLIDGHTYYATTVDPPCESTNRLPVLVHIYQPNNPGTNGQRNICLNQIATTTPFDLLNVLGGTPDNTGVWSGPIPTSNGSQGTLDVSTMTLAGSPYVFTYTVSNPSCANATSTVTITVLPLATATVAVSPTIICAGSTSAINFTGTPNATVVYTIGGGSNQTIVLNGTGTASVSNTYNTTTVVNIVSISSATTPSCINNLPSSTTITVIDLPTATASFDLNPICVNTNSTLTFTGTANATVTYTINSGANQTIVLNAAGTATLPGTYAATTTVTLVSVATSGSPSCTKALSQTITLTVIDPTASVSFSQPTICVNTTSNLNFTGTPNATVTYTINAGANQTIVLDGSGTASLPGTYSSNTTVTLISVTTSGIPSCTKILNQTITLTVIDPIANASFSLNPICANTTSTLTFTGTPNATVTYTINSGANQTIVLNGAGTATLPGTYAATTIVTLINVTTAGSPSCTKILNQTITLTVIDPTASASFDLNPICANSTSNLTFTGTPNATVTYTVNNGANQTIVLNGAGSATLSGTYAATTTVTLVSVTTAGSPSCTKPLNQVITLTVIDPTASASFSPAIVCANTNSTLSFTGTPNATVTYSINAGANQTIVLDGSGNANLPGTYAVNTTVTLVSVTTSGSPTCTKILNQTVTLTVIDPTATAAFDLNPICANSTSNLTFTGTANATVTYTINSGANQTIVLSAAGTATLPGTYAATTIVTLVSVTTAGSPSCTKPLTQTITLTVIDPIANAIFDLNPICANSTSTLTFIGTPNATVTYTINSGANQTIVLDGIGNATMTASYTTSTVVTLISVTTAGSPSCTKILNQSVTLTVIDPTASVSFSPATICANTNSTLTFTGTPNATITYTLNSGANQTIVLDGSGSANLPGTYAANTTATLVSVTTSGSPSCTKLLSQTVTLTVIDPTVSAAFDLNPICANSTSTLTFTGTANATVTYTINGGANQTIVLNAAGTATLPGTYAATATIVLVNVTTAGSPSCTKPLNQTITLTVIDPTASASFSPATICANTTSTLTFTGTPNATVTYTINNGANQTLTLDGSGNATIPGTYAVNATATIVSVSTTSPLSCSKVLNQTVTLTVNPVPNAGNNVSALPLCSNQNPVDLFPYLGSTAQVGGIWTDPSNAVVTNILNPATAASGTYTYTVLGIAPCPNAVATIAVTITPGPEAGQNGPLLICTNSAPYDLFTSLGPNAQPGGTWTNPSNAVVSNMFNPVTDAPGDYTYTLTGTNPCDNDVAVISVTIKPVPDAGTSTTPPIICSNDSPVDLFTLLGGTPQAGGVWTDASNAVISNIFDPAVGVSGVYTYTVVGGVGCSPATATVTLTVVQSPKAGADNSLTACPNSTSLDLTTGLDGTQGAGTFSDDDSTGALAGTIFNPSAVGPGTYHFTYTVGGGAAPCLFDTAVITVVVSPLPNAGTAVTMSPVCNAVGTIDLDSLLSGQDSGGTWTDSALSPVTSPVNISSFAAGTYTYIYTATNTCLQTDTEQVQFTVLANPQIDASNITIAPVCVGLDVAVNLSGLVDGTYALNYDLSGNNTLANQTVTVTVTGSTASFIIPTASVPVSGTTTITFTNMQNVTTTCQVALTNVTGTIVINPAVQIDNANISVANVCLTNNATVTITNAVNLPDGDYLFNYTIPTGTPALGSSGNVSIAGGNGVFTIPSTVFAGVGTYTITINSIITATGCSNTTEDATTSFNVVTQPNPGTPKPIVSVCPSDGIFDLNTLLTGQDMNGDWRDNTGTIVTSPITIINFTPGTYTYCYTVTNACGTSICQPVQFTVLPNPLLFSFNISTTSACLGTDTVVNLNGLADGTYTLNYDITGANTLPGQQVVVTITGATGSFTIPTASLPLAGATVISFTNITNNATACFHLLSNVASLFTVKPLADIDSSNLSATTVCFGNAVTVTIANATNLPDGVYQFAYSMPGANPATGTSGDVTITGGAGQFTLPAAVFPTAVTYTLTITGITTATGCANQNENAAVSIVVNAIPDATGASIVAQATCANFDSSVTISGATTIPDGNYTINYTLSGANIATTTATVTFAGGVATFIIPAASLTLAGDTTITVTAITSLTSTCGGPLTTTLASLFNVSSLATPVLVADGNKFCTSDNPTIASLSANIVGTPPVLWYNALTGGTAYATTDLLVDGVKYYATLVGPSGCESGTRLEVLVDLAGCDDLVFPDGFSPNGDGINDAFVITNLATMYPNFKLEIYNRYGNLVYKGDINTPNWGGTTTEAGLNLGNNLLPTGVYFYIVYFNDGIRSPKQDRVYLSR